MGVRFLLKAVLRKEGNTTWRPQKQCSAYDLCGSCQHPFSWDENNKSATALDSTKTKHEKSKYPAQVLEL